MEKQLTITVVSSMGGEDGLSIACKEGKLFRNDAQLEDLYKDGFRVYNYDVIDDVESQRQRLTRVRVVLKK